jgi:hypothetical protein
VAQVDEQADVQDVQLEVHDVQGNAPVPPLISYISLDSSCIASKANDLIPASNSVFEFFFILFFLTWPTLLAFRLPLYKIKTNLST